MNAIERVLLNQIEVDIFKNVVRSRGGFDSVGVKSYDPGLRVSNTPGVFFHSYRFVSFAGWQGLESCPPSLDIFVQVWFINGRFVTRHIHLSSEKCEIGIHYVYGVPCHYVSSSRGNTPIQYCSCRRSILMRGYNLNFSCLCRA